MISLVLAESSLELVPPELRNHPSVTSHAKRCGKHPSEILLDNSWHFAAMKGIRDEIKRGRPDLVHFAILEATAIPLYQKDRLELYVHTIDDRVISFGPGLRIPKSYHRFAGLIEKLYGEGQITSGDSALLEIKNQTFAGLVDELRPARTIGLSRAGTISTYRQIASGMPDGACIVIGGFQKGIFSESVTKRLDALYSVGEESLEAHVVVARMLYECEKTIFM